MSQLNFTGRYYRFYPQDKLLGHKEHLLNLGTTKTALLAVDVGGMGHEYLQEMEKREIIAKNGSIGVTDKGKKFHTDYSKINDLISEISKTITEE